MTGKAYEAAERPLFFESEEQMTPLLKALTVQVVNDNAALQDGLMEIARSQALGALHFQFGTRADGLQPLLEPGLDAMIVNIGEGQVADFAFLHRVIALGPHAPVIAVSIDDPDIHLLAIQAGAEDCLSFDTGSPRDLVLSLRRAVARWQVRETRDGPDAAQSQTQVPQVTLVQEASDAIVILDNRGYVRFANAAAEELLGREGSDLIGKPFGLPSEIGEHDVAVLRPDGDNRFAEMRIIETRWGGLPARVAALNDVTVRRRLEQTMQEARAQSFETKQRSHSFFSNVNHDLRTPLTHIIGFSELMKNEQFGPIGAERYRDYASDIHSSGTMLLDMIEDLLGIAEAESDQISLTDEICNLGQLVDIAVASQRGQAQHEQVKLEIDCPAKLPGIRGDARRLRQGLFRLIAEAIHCAHPGAVLRLTVRETASKREEDSGIEITIAEEVSDHNKSMIQTRLPHLADDPFVSTENSGIARSESLALSLTRKVMELHGGQMTIGDRNDDAVNIALSFPASRVIR